MKNKKCFLTLFLDYSLSSLITLTYLEPHESVVIYVTLMTSQAEKNDVTLYSLFQIRGTTWSTRIRADDCSGNKDMNVELDKLVDSHVNIEIDVSKESETPLKEGLKMYRA